MEVSVICSRPNQSISCDSPGKKDEHQQVYKTRNRTMDIHCEKNQKLNARLAKARSMTVHHTGRLKGGHSKKCTTGTKADI